MEFVIKVIVNTGMTLLYGLMLMLAIGIAHAEWWPAVPTVGYWWAVILTMFFRGAFSYLPVERETT